MDNTNLKEANNNDVSMITYFVFVTFILILIIGLSFIGIAISSGKDLEIVINILNNVGGAIGGITSPIIGIISIMLVYMAYSQQLAANKLLVNSNNLLKEQINQTERLEDERLINIRNLIITDLQQNIKPELLSLSKELNESINNMYTWSSDIVNCQMYNHLSSYCFDSISKADLYNAMPNEYIVLVRIYSNLEFIKRNSLYYLQLQYIDMQNDTRFITDKEAVNTSKFKEIMINGRNTVELCNEFIDKYIDKYFPVANATDSLT